MNSITYIGMDVHSTNYALCAFTMGGQKFFGQTSINSDIKELVKHLKTLNVQQGGKVEFVCGYEAGCLGYTLYHELNLLTEPFSVVVSFCSFQLTMYSNYI